MGVDGGAFQERTGFHPLKYSIASIYFAKLPTYWKIVIFPNQEARYDNDVEGTSGPKSSARNRSSFARNFR
jgi:hypothetical protein